MTCATPLDARGLVRLRRFSNSTNFFAVIAPHLSSATAVKVLKWPNKDSKNGSCSFGKEKTRLSSHELPSKFTQSSKTTDVRTRSNKNVRSELTCPQFTFH